MRTLHVVTHQRWVADEFMKQTPEGWQANYSYGLDIPVINEGDAIWTPLEWATRAQLYGLEMPLQAPAANATELFSQKDLGRTVYTGFYEIFKNDFIGLDTPVFAKLAAMKFSSLPARWYNRFREFDFLLKSLEVPPMTVLDVCFDRMVWETEFRLFVVDGKVLGGSKYKVGDAIYAENKFDTAGLTDAVNFGQSVIDPLRDKLPDSYTLDVGLTHENVFNVIEVNPAFSSARYDTPVDVVWESVIASTARPDPKHLFVPDPFLVQTQKNRRLNKRTV